MLEGKGHCTRALPTFASVMSINLPLAKPSHVGTPNINGVGMCILSAMMRVNNIHHKQQPKPSHPQKGNLATSVRMVKIKKKN